MSHHVLLSNGCQRCAVPNLHTIPSFPQSFWPRRKPWSVDALSLTNYGREQHWSAFSITNPRHPMPKQPLRLRCRSSRSGVGDDAGLWAISRCSTNRDAGASPIFPPLDRATIQAMACEIVHQTKQPLSRQSLADLTKRACAALKRPIGRSTVWRILHEADLKPWRYKYWIFPRDPRFAEKAEVVLDLYAGFWQEKPLGNNDYILSSDEKTSIQARLRCHASLPPAPGRHQRIEFEYARGGALQYLAAWDVRRGVVFGRCEASTGIEPFGRLVVQVMEQEPYRSAERVFWVVDNGSSHRGTTSIQRLAKAYSKAHLVHTPVHASWLNQVEIYFSKIQRKVLTPNDFASLDEVQMRLRLYEELTNRTPRPFQWKFNRAKLAEFLDRMSKKNAACET